MEFKRVSRNIVIASRVIAGTVFIFSGFVKGVDPPGITFKLIDYFNAFHLGFLNPLTFFFSIILNKWHFIDFPDTEELTEILSINGSIVKKKIRQ